MTLKRRQRIDGTGVALTVSAVLGGGLSGLPTARAADEDTSASVYLVFDPETGEFVTVHDTDGTAQAQETQEAIESVADAGGATSIDAGDAQTGTGGPDIVIGVVVAAIVVAAAVFVQRSRRSA